MPPSIVDDISETRDDILRVLVGDDSQQNFKRGTQQQAEQNERRTSESSQKTAKRPRRSSTPPAFASKGVRFSNVTTREYERVVGDHDDLLGPPLAIGWAYNQHDAVDISSYEEQREENRRPEWELLLTPNGRRHLLMNEFGYSAEELTQAEKRLIAERRSSEQMASAGSGAGQKKERRGSILKRARRKIGKRLSLDKVGDMSSFIAMSSPFASAYAGAR